MSRQDGATRPHQGVRQMGSIATENSLSLSRQNSNSFLSRQRFLYCDRFLRVLYRDRDFSVETENDRPRVAIGPGGWDGLDTRDRGPLARNSACDRLHSVCNRSHGARIVVLATYL